MSREIFFDRLMISDGEFDLSEIESVYEYLKSLHGKVGKITNDPHPEETSFMLYNARITYSLEDLEKDNPNLDVLFLKKVMGMNLIPVLENHDIDFTISAHEMIDGGGMTFHNDFIYSCAVSIYLNSVEGGEFQAKFQGSNNINSIIEVEPKAGRAVVVKADTVHRVAKVITGTRRNIQIFIKYVKKDQ